MHREILREADTDGQFHDRIAATEAGKELTSCIQCGTCSGTCPIAHAVDYSPRQLIALLRAGAKEDVLKSLAPWLCASCYECTVKCPGGVKITEVMYALRRAAMEEGLHPEQADIHRFVKLFCEQVEEDGRIHELGLMLRYMGPKHPLRLLAQAPVGLKMMAKGRMSFTGKGVKDKAGLSRIVARARELSEEVKT